MINKFTIEKNAYVERDINGYYHQYYTGYNQPGNPDFLNTLKNTFLSILESHLVEARNQVVEILNEDIPQIMRKEGLSNCILICVPRAKSLHSYSKLQLMFKEAVKISAKSIPDTYDGTDCIQRIRNTFTTHLRNAPNIPNDGHKPYPRITIHTCEIDNKLFNDRSIILIDDIYTKSVNVDEDCIQALIDNGAKNVIFYAIGYTRRVQ